MPPPTTAVLFSASEPAAPPGQQLAIPQTDGARPAQRETFVIPLATADLAGAVRPGAGLEVVDGTLNVIAAPGGGSGSGQTGASFAPVVPAGAKDGSNTQYTLPAPVLADTGYFYVRNGVMQRQLGQNAEFAVQGTQLTTKTPLQSYDWHEFYYTPGTPNSEAGGGGSAPPAGLPPFRGTPVIVTSTGFVTIPLPSDAQAGDFAVAYASGGPSPSAPAGWTNSGASSPIWTRTLTSGDISTGSVTLNTSGAGAAGLAVLVGATGGLREVDGTWGVSSVGTVTTNTSSAVLATDYGIIFGQVSAGASISVSAGVPLGSFADGNAGGVLTAMNMPAGVSAIGFTVVGSSHGGSEAVVIVKAF